MAGNQLFEAVKAAVQEELQELREKQGEQDRHFSELKAALEDVSGRVEERAREAQQLREDVERRTSELEGLDAKARAELQDLAAGLRERLDRIESDQDGLGGLEQLRQRLQAVAEEAAKAQAQAGEQGKVVGACKSRTDAFDDALRQLSRTSDEVSAGFEASEERLREVEALSRGVRERQQLVEDSVARKYASLWEEVLKAVEDVKGQHAHALREDLERRDQETRREGRGHVRYVTQLVAAVHDERKKLAMAKDLVSVWREQTWASARRRTALHWLCSALHAMSGRRQRKALSRWVRAASIEGLAERLRKEYDARIPDVHRVVEDTGLRERCEGLAGEVKELRGDKCSSKDLQEVLKNAASLVEDKLGLVHNVKSELLKHHETLHESITKAHEQHHELGEKVEQLARAASVGEKLDDHERRLATIVDSVSVCATSKEVQAMMRDIIMMWNSIKQLDGAKADKKDVDCFATESSMREKYASKKLEDVQAEVTGLVKEEVGRVEARCSELDGRLGDGTKQFQHWEEMWEKLTGHVEDLVAKVAEIQQSAAAGRLHAAPPVATLRPGSRPSSASRGGRPEVPPLRSSASSAVDRSMPESASSSSLLVASPGPSGPLVPEAESTSETQRWISSARSIMDAALEQTAAPRGGGGAKLRPARPRSASSRRAADRGRS